MEIVQLSITPSEGFPGNYKIIVSGSGFVPNQEVLWRLRGEDPVFDDNIIAPRGSVLVGLDGTFAIEDNAISGHLNEDWGEDDIFADVYYADIGGSHYKSNTVHGNF